MIFSRNSSRPAEIDLCWQAIGRWSYFEWLQHPEGVHASSGVAIKRRGQEKKEEDLHHSKKDQAQESQGQNGNSQILQGGCYMYYYF